MSEPRQISYAVNHGSLSCSLSRQLGVLGIVIEDDQRKAPMFLTLPAAKDFQELLKAEIEKAEKWSEFSGEPTE